jgi:hypothetical protein
MSDQRLEQLERRLASAERDLAAGRRVVRRGGATAAAVVCGTLLMALRAPAPGPEPLTVKVPFVVQDRSGEVLLEVDDTKDGRGLIVTNGAGTPVAGLYSAHEGGQVKVNAPDGPTAGSATMWITKEGTPRIELDGQGDAPLATLGVYEKKTRFNLFNQAGANVAQVAEQSNGAGLVTAFNADQTANAALGADDAGHAGLRLKAGGKVLAELGAAEKGNARLKIWGAQGAPVAIIGSDANGSGGAVVVNSGDGKPRGVLRVADGGGQLYVWGDGENALAQVGVDGGRGTLRIFNKTGGSVVWMDESATGAGHLAVADPSGAAAAEMGFNGTGIVRALGPGGKIDYLRGPR